MERKSAHRIDQEAAQWAAKIDAGTLSKEAGAAFDAWLESDVRCPGAYARMRAVSLMTEQARALGTGFEAPLATPSSRRWFIAAGAVAAVLLATVGYHFAPSATEHYVSTIGEMKTIKLEDGSILTLNTQSEVTVHYTRTRRQLELIHGEAIFAVAKNKERPFVVTAGDTNVRAVGTSFSVSRVGAIKILVQEGTVEVGKNSTEASPALRVPHNSGAITQEGAASIRTFALSNAELYRDLAWRDGHLAFEGQTLAEAAAEFSRYSDMKIVILDKKLAAEEIAGRFRATDPIGFARNAAISLKAHAEVSGKEIRLSR